MRAHVTAALSKSTVGVLSGRHGDPTTAAGRAGAALVRVVVVVAVMVVVASEDDVKMVLGASTVVG